MTARTRKTAVTVDDEPTEEMPAIEFEPGFTFESAHVVVDGIGRITTVCSVCGFDVESGSGVHSTSLIRRTIERCPNCGSRNEAYGR